MKVVNRSMSVLAAGLLLSTALVAVSPAQAQTLGDDVLTSSEITASLDNAGALVQLALPSVSTSQEAAIASSGGVTVEVPQDLKAGVDLTGTGLDLTIHLPNAEDAGAGVKNSDGQIVYPSSEASSNTVIPVTGGVQMLTTIANAQAPTTYRYDIEVPAGGTVVVNEDGSAQIVDGSGQVVLFVQKAWAKDANDISVPTHYETDGASLTQVIEHTSAEYAYPVSADPSWGWYAGGYGLSLSRAETKNLTSYSNAVGFCVAFWWNKPASVSCGIFGAQISTQASIVASRNGCLFVAIIPMPLAIQRSC